MFYADETRRTPEGHVASPKSVADVHATSAHVDVSATFSASTHSQKRIPESCGQNSKVHFAADLHRDSSTDVLPEKRRIGDAKAGPVLPKKRRNWAPIALVPMRNIRLPTNMDPGLLLELKVQYQDMAAMEQQIFGVSTLLSLVKWVLKGHADLKKIAALGRRLSKTRKRFLNVQRGLFDVHNERNSGAPRDVASVLVCGDSNTSNDKCRERSNLLDYSYSDGSVQTAIFHPSNRLKSISCDGRNDEVCSRGSRKEFAEKPSASPHASLNHMNQPLSIHQYGSALVSPSRGRCGIPDDSYCASQGSFQYPFVQGGVSTLAAGILHSEMTNPFDPNNLHSCTNNGIGGKDVAKNHPLRSNPADDLNQNLQESMTRTGDYNPEQLQTPATSIIPSGFQFAAHQYPLIPDRSHTEHSVPSNSLEMFGARNANDSTDFLPEIINNRKSGGSHLPVSAAQLFAKESGVSSSAVSHVQSANIISPSTLSDLSATAEIGHQTAFPGQLFHSAGTNIPVVPGTVLENMYSAQINALTLRVQNVETSPVEFFAVHYGGGAICPGRSVDGESVLR